MSRGTPAMKTKKVAYIMSRFPHLPETFILREMDAMASLGWPISLYPLILQKSTLTHQEARPWLSRAQHLSICSRASAQALGALILSRPRLFLRILRAVIEGYRKNLKVLIKALAIIPKSVLAAQRMQDEGIDHIHAHYATYPALAAWIIHQLTGIPFSVTVHAHDIFVDRSMLKIKLEAATFIAAISEFNRTFLITHLGAEISHKIRIVHCGINPKDYDHPRTAPPGTDETFRIMTTGSLQPYKGQTYLIEACALLKERGVHFSCQIVGGGSLHGRLSREIQRWHLGDQIQLVGAKAQDEVAALLAESDCYVQPSVIMPSGKMEGIPVSIMEAMASGIPVIASDISGISELVSPDETGYLVPPEDAKALADGLEYIYRNPTLALQRARQGRMLVNKAFNLTHSAGQLGKAILESNCP